MAWKPWQLDDPLMFGPEVVKIQHRLLYAYGRNSEAAALGVRETGVYDAATAQAVKNLQPHFQPALEPTGIADFATKRAMGVIVTAAAKPTVPVFTVPGTVANWNQGPPAETAWGCDPKRFRQQGVGFSTDAFLMGDPAHSYLDARNEGTAELLRLSLPDRGKKVWVGYSMGADVVVRALAAWPTERRDEIACVITFGSPGRPPGKTLLGNDPGGAGISGFYTPEWARDREYSFAIDGDMYPEAVGLLPTFYDILTRMDMSIEFMGYLFGLLTSSIGPLLLGLVPGGNVLGAGGLSSLLGLITPGKPSDTSEPINLMAMMLNIPAIISTLVAAVKFLFTNAHYHYSDQPVFDGLTGVDKARQIINALPV